MAAPSSRPILSLRDLHLSIGNKPLFKGLTLHIGVSETISVLGRNGTGKSTLLKVMSGLVEADGGERFLQPGTSVSYLPQEPDAGGFATLRDFILSGLAPSQEGEEYRADVLIEALSVPGESDPATVSGGELRRAALAKAVISEPDLLMLDEPTNHLDIGTILWLEDWLKTLRGSLVLISHDRAFLAALSKSCLWLDRGVVRRFDGPFDKFDAWQEEQLTLEREERKKLDKLIKDEGRWAVEGISARRKRNQGRVRRLLDLRQTRREQIAQVGSVEMSVSAGKRSGSKVIEAVSVAKSYGERTLFSDFSTRIVRGDRVGILGPNGAGKSTLLKVLLGEVAPDRGTVKLGSNMTPLVIDQKRSKLEPHLTVKDVLTGGRGDYVHRSGGEGTEGQAVHVMTYMKEFLFDSAAAGTTVDALSGGERGRLLLARGFASSTNLMVLDEPTNDLDMDTLDLLVDVLADYDGTLLLVSHDRDFLDRVVTSTIVLEGDGTATEYAGGYSDYLIQKKAVAGARTEENADESKSTGKRTEDKGRATENVVQLAASKSRSSKGKLSYKDQRALELLPAEVEALSSHIQTLELTLSDPMLYRKDPKKFNELSREIETQRGVLEEKELRWLELEELKEELESGT